MSTARAAEILAKLAAHGVPIRATYGGGVSITEMDVAAACAGLPALQTHLVRAKYALDSDSLEAVIALLHERREAYKWLGQVGTGVADAVLRVVVDDFLSHNRCPSCTGRGYQGIRLCRRCSGSGMSPASMRDRARRAGMQYHTWRDRYQAEAEDLLSWLYQIEVEALSHIDRRLFPRLNQALA